MAEADLLHCSVYKSLRKQDTYLYITDDKVLERLPDGLARLLGELELVMELDLHPGRRLAREDVLAVMHSLRVQGFHLQLPPVEQEFPAS
jgi:uncharacterized protein YcgL (UPF0745 family)